jgi:Bacterial CdiA-CT RNAse A domain
MSGCKRITVFKNCALPFLLWSLMQVACQSSQPGSTQYASGLSATREEHRAASGSVRDLSQDEAAGGHTLRKHVGRSDEELRQRLRHERNIAAASTWSDRETAERAVGTAVEQNRERIERWLDRQGGHPNLVIDYDGDPSHPIGRTLRRDADQAELCSHATVVLKWTGPNDYYVLTSYPECRA